MTAELNDIDAKTAQPDFWKDTQAAAKVNRRKATLDRELSRWRETERRQSDIEAMLELATETGDPGLEGELIDELSQFEKAVAQFRIELLLSGELDSSNAIFAIHPGAGGTESQDWAQMLLRMYVRWAERKGYKIETLDLLAGDEAGIKSATLSVTGPYAYGYLKAEAGVHRLVRISPFDANKRRHTSFASVFVYPELDDDVQVVIDDKDLGSTRFGPAAPAVRTSIRLRPPFVSPTFRRTSWCNARTNGPNCRIAMGAMKILKARLFEVEQHKKEAEFNAIVGEKKDIAWGSQIRSYVFQPYQIVKDHRTCTRSVRSMPSWMVNWTVSSRRISRKS